MQAAGVLFLASDKVLLMHRTDGQGWACPGGGIEEGETAEQAARREVSEETGLAFDGELTLWTRRNQNDVDFTTFLAKCDEFKPVLNEEHDGYNWVTLDFALSSTALHPGVAIQLRRFTMDELDIAKAMIAGELTSPQRYRNLMLVAIRITGTGGAYRPAHDEYVWRDPSLYMNQEFLERCNGLPVIFRHPEKSMLTTEEFRDRIVGTVFVPFLRPETESVWGIAKILDMRAADLLENYQMSTSPAVLCLGENIPTSDGRDLLIENKPTLLDHIALLIPETEDGDIVDSGQGVWDVGKGLSGVESIDALPNVQDDEPSPLDVIVSAITNRKIDELSRRSDRR